MSPWSARSSPLCSCITWSLHLLGSPRHRHVPENQDDARDVTLVVDDGSGGGRWCGRGAPPSAPNGAGASPSHSNPRHVHTRRVDDSGGFIHRGGAIRASETLSSP